MSEQRLISWKQIAAYFGVTVRTAQRWEATEGLPVRRHRHSTLSTVYADRAQLDRWWECRPARVDGIRPAEPAATSIAVLPFANLDRDEETEILSDGLTEDLIIALSRIPQLRVVARFSAFYFKGSEADSSELGSRLNVAYVVTGSVRRAGNRLRVTARMIRASDGSQVWASAFDREIADAFDIQEQLAGAIADNLHVELFDGGRRRGRPRRTDAYLAYLRGRFFWKQRNLSGLRKALGSYEDAIRNEPDFAAAHAGIADCLAFLWIYCNAPRSVVVPMAEAAAKRAIELDPNLGDGHASIGVLRVMSNDFPAGERAFANALRLNPADERARHWHGCVIGCLGRHEESIADLEKALTLDPYDGNVNSDAAFMHYLAGRYDAAIRQFRHTLAVAPKAPWLRAKLALALFHAGAGEEALAQAEISGEPVIAAWIRAQKGDAGPALSQLQDGGSGSPSFSRQAVLCLGLGRHERAIDLFRRGAARYEREFLPLFSSMRPLFVGSGRLDEFDSLLRP